MIKRHGCRPLANPHPSASTPSRYPSTPTSTSALKALLLIAGLTTSLSSPLTILARPTPFQDTLQPPLQDFPSDYSGKDFAGIELRLPSRQGPFRIKSQRATIWLEQNSASQTPIRRMLLTGDVQITLGSSTFNAARATLWIEQLQDTRQQVAIYFDRVITPTSGSGSGQSGDRLLVLAHAAQDCQLLIDSPPLSVPSEDPFVREGEAKLARYLRQIDAQAKGESLPPDARQPFPLVGPMRTSAPYVPGQSQPFEPGSPLGPDGPRLATTRLKREDGFNSPDQSLFSPRGVVTIAAGSPVFQANAGPQANESHLLVTGGVVLQYSEPSAPGSLGTSSATSSGRQLELSAQNAVVFLKGGAPENLLRTGAESVLGIYLEGDVVASDGRFNLRAPYIYYDLQTNQAYTVDAVFWTYDQVRNLPLYLRAKSIRQTSRTSVTAEGVSIATSAFFDAALSLGASSVTLKREPRPGDPTGPSRVTIDAKGISPKLGGIPFFYFPKFTGDIERMPLKDVRFENSSGSGFGIKTRFDVFGLANIDPPEGVEFDLLVDAWLRRGAGIGIDLQWGNIPQTGEGGSLFAYTVPSDNGKDILTSGAEIERDDDFRGIFLYDQRLDLSAALGTGWTATLEGSHISDETFVDAYYEPLAETRREFTNQLLLRNTDANAIFTARIKGALNDFTSNEYLLQSQGFTVNRLPELSYARVADDLLSGVSPGLLTWTQTYSVTRLQFDFTEPTARELGFFEDNDAQLAFGLNPDQSLAERLRASGLTEKTVTRGDMRQQLDLNLNLGPIKITPFAVGRVTGWDEEFAPEISGDSNDQVRLWYAGGVRASTQFQKLDPTAISDSLDITGIRHIVEPNITLWSAGTNRRSESLPIYDYDVEGISEGSVLKLGVVNTWQTKRGDAGLGPTSTRVIDWLTLDVNYIASSSDTQSTSVIGRWFETRPEESTYGGGEFLSSDVKLALTDATTINFSNTYDFDVSQNQRTVIGYAITHSADFSTFAELRFLNPRDTTFIDVGLDYRLTPKYTISGVLAYDTDQGDVQTLALRLNREFSDLLVSAKFGYNDITDEFTTGIIFTPLGRSRKEEQLRRIGRDQFLESVAPSVSGGVSALAR